MSGALFLALLSLGHSACAQAPSASVQLLPPTTDDRIAPVAKDDLVLRWNEVLLRAVRDDRTPPPLAARNMAMVHVAIYDAVNAISPTHSYYLVDVRPMAGASAEAATAAAAHQVLVALYPKHKRTFDEALTASFAELRPGESRNCGEDLGRFVADQVLQWRRDDLTETATDYSPRSTPGLWQPTAPAFKPALMPEWGRSRPFAVQAGARLRPSGPPALGSEKYVAAFREVRALGGKDTAKRTAEQTEIALFWADDGGTSTPPGHWNRIAQDVARARGTTLA